jgi:hypothetical protein
LAGPHLQSTLAADGLYMALSTATAYSLSPAHVFCDVLAKRFALSPLLRDRMELAVHEAVINGVLHGNLEIGSDDRQTWEGFQRFCESVANRLKDPALAGRSIEILAIVDAETISLSVIDSGPGYDPIAMSPAGGEAKSGWGLSLIHRLAEAIDIGDGGRKITMRFHRLTQEDILPSRREIELVGSRTGLIVEALFQPSAEMGGDLWGLRPLNETSTAFFLADFSGHGRAVAADTFTLYELWRELAFDPGNPGGFLSALNDRLVEILPRGRFATMFLGVVDSRRGQLTFAAAGAPQPVIANPEAQLLDTCGIPLAVSPGTRYDNWLVPFPMGSALLLFSDALTETPDPRGICLAAADLAGAVADGVKGERGALASMMAGLLSGRPPPSDDLTVVWVRQV